MRTLIEQTEREANGILYGLDTSSPFRVTTLMGVRDDVRSYDESEHDSVLIGTQNMLLSRAFNGRYRKFEKPTRR